MPLLVHIAPQNEASRIRRNGLRPRRVAPEFLSSELHDRVVWAFPVLASYTLTHSWSRELKRWGRTSLVAVTFRIPDAEEVYARHFARAPMRLSAAEAAGMIRAAADPRGYEIMIPRRIEPGEIRSVCVLPEAVGWRYWPEAKNLPLRVCDCPMCSPKGEVKAARYRRRVAHAMASFERK